MRVRGRGNARRQGKSQLRDLEMQGMQDRVPRELLEGVLIDQGKLPNMRFRIFTATRVKLLLLPAEE